jgi:hypothetical protein
MFLDGRSINRATNDIFFEIPLSFMSQYILRTDATVESE